MEQNKSMSATRLFILAWVFGLIFYFLDYVIRSSPAVMLPQLAEQFKVTPVTLVTIIGTYYYTYSTVSLLAGLALDKFGTKYSLFIGTFILGLGCLLFVLSHSFSGNAGRLLQGAGCAFAFPGCVYLASKGFSAKSLATAIGFTQCIGMLGGSAGQFIVGPWIEQGLKINHFWLITGLITIVVAFGLLLVIPKNADQVQPVNQDSSKGILWPYKVVFSNPQSWLCGIISGLLFAPTTIFAMTWGVAFFQQDRDFSFHTATIASAMIPMGWVLGCPLLGYITDRIGARKPVLMAGATMMILAICQVIFMPDLLSAYTTNFIFGVASGAAMIPYSVIKESNPDEVKGSATGAINFITFGVTTLLNPIFSKFFGQTLSQEADKSTHFQLTGLFWIAGIGIAIILMFFLKETGQKKVNKSIS
ncbi:MFS transporter [Sphingobacterium faecium]|uniref:MFS transporter n=1 Tax=Sphingobacterium faecium TaxID=34087 RepID=UPI002478A8A4|nr:MFS transporter [Sphingobacterium faecium]WGQ14229.1 MFS transporter [Sphingobacterium faecium]